MRALDETFLRDLKDGVLAPLADLVKSDTSLCLELRGKYINVYYRGGNLLNVRTRDSNGNHSMYFDENYFEGGHCIEYPKIIKTSNDVERLINVLPKLKGTMDRYFSNHRNEKGEYQQVILRDNNFSSIAIGTDYYICDIEYQSDYGRFDMVCGSLAIETAYSKKYARKKACFH